MRRIYFHGFIGLLLLGGSLVGCAAKEASPAGTPAQPETRSDAPQGADANEAIAMELAAYERAKPVFDKYCADCHTTEKAKGPDHEEALEDFTMDGYPFGGEHAHELGHEIREVLGAEGDEPTMPMDDPGVIQGEELALVLAWAEAFDKAQAARGVEAGDHGHGEDEHGGDHE